MPAPSTSMPLAVLSPSKIERLIACPLRIAFEQARPPGSANSPEPSALVGLAVHRAIELFLRGAELQRAWEQACEELAEGGGDPRYVPTARRARLRLERRLPDLLLFIESRGPSELLLEHRLASADGSVVGRLDLLVLGQRPCVIDFKTGLVDVEGVLDTSHLRQLALYVWLAATHLQRIDVGAAWFSLRQGIVEVDAPHNQSAAVVRLALAARHSYNERAPGPQPATPSTSGCGRCESVGHCHDGWNGLRDGRVERFGWGEAGRALISGPVVVADNGSAAVPIDVTDGTITGLGTLVDVPHMLVRGLDTGDRLSIWRVAKRADEPLALAWLEGISCLEAGPL